MSYYKLELTFIILALTCLGVGVTLAIKTCEAHWLARFSALMIVLAVIVETRLASRRDDTFSREQWRSWLAGVLTIRGLSPFGHFLGLTAHMVILGGTLLWAFGDLLPVCR